MGGGSLKKHTQLAPNFFSSAPALVCSEATTEHAQQTNMLIDFGGNLDNLYLDAISPPFQYGHQYGENFPCCQPQTTEIIEPMKGPNGLFPVTYPGIVTSLTKRSTQVDGKEVNLLSYERTKASEPRLSATAIVRLAGERLIQSCTERVNELSEISNPFAYSFMGLSDGEARDIELVQDLLVCADKVGQQQMDSATNLISQFHKLSFKKGNPVQRLVYHFADALLEKINQEKGFGSGKRPITDLLESMMSPNSGIIAFHQKLPFSQICQFTSVQTIIENVKEAKMVHIIDFEIRNGMQWTVLMEALVAHCSYSLQNLKITAVGTISGSRSRIEETGERLKSFAQSKNLPFTFNIVMVSTLLDLNINLFELDDEEEVAIYLSHKLATLIVKPDHLDYLMRVIHDINPCVTVISEVESNHTSPAFVNRFVETLFYYSAFFDSLDDCMADDEENRSVSEKHFSMTIHNIVSVEGPERIMRHIRIDVWRAFLERYGMVEAELSSMSRYQADLLVQKFDCGSSSTIYMNGKSMIVGWKGAPIFSVSSWKFVK